MTPVACAPDSVNNPRFAALYAATVAEHTSLQGPTAPPVPTHRSMYTAVFPPASAGNWA